MIKVLLLGFFLLLTQLMNGQRLQAPANLRTDLLLHTSKVFANGMQMNLSLEKASVEKGRYQFVSIISEHPLFSWETEMSVKKTTAFQLLIATSLELLNENKGDIWDSKKKNSLKSQVRYVGNPLLSGHIYYWKVKVWNNKDVSTSFSKAAAFFYDAPQADEPFSYYPLTGRLQHPKLTNKMDDGSYFFDFGKDAFAQLQLKLSSSKKDSIWIEVGEALENKFELLKTVRNIRYLRIGLAVNKGTHQYTVEWPVDEKRNSRNPILMPAYIGEVFPFRFVKISNFDGAINSGDVIRKMVAYPFDNSSSDFISSDTVLNKVWELCKYSIEATSFTGYYVDGDRERLPYEADALINQLSHYAVDAEYSMARRSMAYLLYHPTWPTEWSLQNISLAWNDYLYTGDNFYLGKYYSELQKKILMPLAGVDGLISTRTGKQTEDFLNSIHMVKDFDGKHGLKDIVDWPQTGTYIGDEKEFGGETDGFVYTNYNAVINAWYYQSLGLMQQIAGELGYINDMNLYAQKKQQVYESFQKIFRDPQSGLIKDGDSTVHTSLHSNMFALAFGLVSEDDKAAVASYIKTRKLACSVYGAQFLLDALYNAGEDDYALQLLTATTQRSWYNMLRTGSTITMEAWDKVYKPNLDLNHAWGSAPANIIVRKLMGVEPITPSGERIRIKPQVGNLQFASLITSTLKGKVKVTIRKAAANNMMEITIPGATTAEVYIATNPSKSKLSIDGKRVAILPVNGFYLIENVGSGHHLFTLHK